MQKTPLCRAGGCRNAVGSDVRCRSKQKNTGSVGPTDGRTELVTHLLRLIEKAKGDGNNVHLPLGCRMVDGFGDLARREGNGVGDLGEVDVSVECHVQQKGGYVGPVAAWVASSRLMTGG